MKTKEIPLFTLTRFNQRRVDRGAEGAEVEVTWPDGETETLWMSKKDIRANIKEYGEQAGLIAALEAYGQIDKSPCAGATEKDYGKGIGKQ